MATLELPKPNLVGRIAYIEPLKQWGYLHGPTGERVYFHASAILGGIAELGLGDEVCYGLTDGGDQLCSAQVIPRGRCGQ